MSPVSLCRLMRSALLLETLAEGISRKGAEVRMERSEMKNRKKERGEGVNPTIAGDNPRGPLHCISSFYAFNAFYALTYGFWCGAHVDKSSRHTERETFPPTVPLLMLSDLFRDTKV